MRHALDGLPRRSRYRTAELGRIDAFSQFTATYAWTPPGLRAIRTPRASVAATGCQHMPTELDMLSNTCDQLLNTSEGGLGDAITAPAHRVTVS